MYSDLNLSVTFLIVLFTYLIFYFLFAKEIIIQLHYFAIFILLIIIMHLGDKI